MDRFLLKWKPVEAVTYDEILQLVRQRTQTLKNKYIPDIKTLLKRELRMNLSTDDCDTRGFQYFQDFTRIVEENKLQGLIGLSDPSSPDLNDGMKKRYRLLVENQHPALMQGQFQRMIEFERRNRRTDDVALFDLILATALFRSVQVQCCDGQDKRWLASGIQAANGQASQIDGG
ncbi:hypothetical protein PF005_g3052 [Phytophthora fragariae]|uniref:Uncharacterized protein n=1 Tax=Phytophthora fragariae TaxID=53985 RepID=A0A6A3M3X0_9STRA|nr:hypothetical protein PF003_g35682 [Phytophthora fragariae]KAE8947084.1 hypothetical protein PF009_g3300 [Phytophthora fragariae]KAE9026579.1 hypothetical protein PF011_g2479 [Phytophthora fragariae]KAE9133711.1 hypothetical protein PF010_g2713 [Phytophthora fragariae]KAE9134380.1 hypothetical protein PF007_g2955 [Phytophthora fragariae]